MANIQSFSIQNDVPVASHGMGADLKVARFQVQLPVTATNDTIEFGFLPQYAVIVDASLHSGAGTFTGDIGVPADADGIFDGVTTVANTVLRASLATLIGKNLGAAPVKVSGIATGAGTAGILNLIVKYVVEDFGVAYPNNPA